MSCTSSSHATNVTVKNTVNYFAKTSPYVLDPAAFALHLGSHFVTRYDHISRCWIDLQTHKWSRIPVEGQPHKWSFVRDGEEKQTVSLFVDGTQGNDKLRADLKMGIRDLLVMKTSGSAFEGFWTDELTTLQAVKDRIFSTSVTAVYTVPLPASPPLSPKTVGDIAAKLNFPRIAATVMKDTLEVFATDESASVQATLYNTAQLVLNHLPAVQEIHYSLPNKHFIPVNMSAFKLDNGLGYEGGECSTSTRCCTRIWSKADVQAPRSSGRHRTRRVSSRPRLRERRSRSSRL